METGVGPGCAQPDVALLAEFGGWLDRERGLSPPFPISSHGGDHGRFPRSPHHRSTR
jgi:hypothetical protein